MIASTFTYLNSRKFIRPASALGAGNVSHLDHHSQMNHAELKALLSRIDEALGVYAIHEGKLTALEISLKSMLSVVRAQVDDQLTRHAAALVE